MVISTRVQLDTSPLDGFQAYLEGIQQIVATEAQASLDIMSPAALSELRDEPPRVKYPIQWTSERQRRAYFATNGFGAGIPYRRTGRLARGWTIALFDRGAGFTLDIRNNAKSAAFVYGSLAIDGSGVRYQQRFHRNTGWQEAYKTTNYWARVFTTTLRERLGERFAEYARLGTTRRGFTRTR